MKKHWIVLLVLASSLFAAGKDNGPKNATTANNISPKKYRDTALQIVAAGLNDPSPYFRVKAIEVVSNTKQKRLMPAVEKLMSDDYVPVRFAAIVAVGDMKYSHSRPALEKLVKVGDENSKIAAAYALAKLDKQKSVSLIQRSLMSDDQKLRANSAMLIGKLGDKSSLKALYQVLIDDNSSDIAMFQAVESIAALGDESIYEKLWTMLISKHADDRIIGIAAMGALGTNQAQNALLTMLYDEVLEVRLAAAAELGRLGNDSGWPEVYDVLTKPLAQIEQETMQRAYDLMMDRQKSEDPDSRPDKTAGKNDSQRTPVEDAKAITRAKTLATIAVGRIGRKELVSHLPALIKDKSKDVRLAAAQSTLLLAP